MSYKVRTASFEGPFDLLLYLVSRQKVDIGAISITEIADQYLAEVTRRADILVAAIGRADFFTADMVKPGAVVVDVGMNRRADGKLTGDVDFASVEPVASAITPVPGGVGPMTITMLLRNTLTAAECFARGGN